MNVKITNANQPSWKNVTVKSHIPAAFQPLDEIAHNLWFCWNQEALDLFRSLDAKIWEDVDQNPVELLNRISYKRLIELSEDKEVLARIKKVQTLPRLYGRKAQRKARFCGLSLYGVWYEPQCEDLLRWSWCARW